MHMRVEEWTSIIRAAQKNPQIAEEVPRTREQLAEKWRPARRDKSVAAKARLGELSAAKAKQVRLQMRTQCHGVRSRKDCRLIDSIRHSFVATGNRDTSRRSENCWPRRSWRKLKPPLSSIKIWPSRQERSSTNPDSQGNPYGLPSTAG
jgi:hypothetical protein